MKHEAMSYPNLRAEFVQKMKTDRTDVRVGPQIKGHPGYEQWRPLFTSLNAPNILATLSGVRRGGTFFKFLKDIYTPAQCEVEVHRGAGAQLCFRSLKRQHKFSLSNGLIDITQT